MNELKLNYLIISLCLLILPSCLDKNDLPTDFTEDLEFNALILREAESRGSFLNTREFPAMLNSEEIFNIMDTYTIIDVRNPQHYSLGHISNSVNINQKQLFNYVLNLNSDKPILLVSINGQASAYYTSLFRIYGLKNIFSLKFGIAGWNKKFVHEILDNCGERSPSIPSFVNNGQYFDLPEIEMPDDSSNIKDIFDNRIKKLFAEGFNEILLSTSLEDKQNDESSCSFGYLKSISDIYLISSTASDLKFDIPQAGASNIYHPFYGMNDFYSTEKLQTIPPNRLIACYSYSGQLSAATVAYLKAIGYNAKSILFGIEYYTYSVLKNSLGTGRLYTFKESNNFPIITN